MFHGMNEPTCWGVGIKSYLSDLQSLECSFTRNRKTFTYDSNQICISMNLLGKCHILILYAYDLIGKNQER